MVELTLVTEQVNWSFVLCNINIEEFLLVICQGNNELEQPY